MKPASGRLLIAIGVVVLAVVTAWRIDLIAGLQDRGYFAKYTVFAQQWNAGSIEIDRLPDLSPAYLRAVACALRAGIGVPEIRAVQVALLSVVALICAAISWRLAGAAAGVAAALLVLLNRAALVNAAEIEPETLLLFFNSLGLLLAMRRGRGAAASAGLSFGLAAAFRPVSLGVVAALAVASLVRRRAGDAVALVAGAAVPVATFMLLNLQLTGSALLMNPGTVFYEGMNPAATALAGVAPRIVKDIEPTLGGPDTMHVAYRLVASRAAGAQLTREEANRYWTGKALAFAKRYPGRAVSLVVSKIRYAVSGYDAYDVQSMVAKERELQKYPAVSFALLVPLALTGLLVYGARSSTVVIYTLVSAIPLLTFFVTARHRNPLVVGLAVLGGCAVAALFDGSHAKRYRWTLAVAAAIAIGFFVLERRDSVQRDDAEVWTAAIETSRLMDRASGPARPSVLAEAQTWLPESVPSAPPQLVRAAALRALGRVDNPTRTFALAIALQQAGELGAAEDVLARLGADRYRPRLRTRAVGSVAYYRARGALVQGHREFAAQHLRAALTDAPGDPDVLALCAVADASPSCAADLARLHDPFTAGAALGLARLYGGDTAAGTLILGNVASRMPEWSRVKLTAEPDVALDTAREPSGEVAR